MDFCTAGINKHFSLAKNVLIVMVPISMNKVVFKPSYNDLKVTVQSRNYICTNLLTFLSFPKQTVLVETEFLRQSYCKYEKLTLLINSRAQLTLNM